METWLSGRKRLRAKELGEQSSRRFESSRLRQMEKFPVNNPVERKRGFLNIGDKYRIGDKDFIISKVNSAAQLGLQFGLNIKREVPVYYFDEDAPGAQGSYHIPEDAVLIFRNATDPSTLEHELTHVIEYKQKATPELVALYQRAKELITEASFSGDFYTFNFMKNIHEFIADGRTQSAFIDALKKEGLYEEFTKETSYLFQ